MIANRRPGPSRIRLQNHDLTQVCLHSSLSFNEELEAFSMLKQHADVL
jgi:hypothetical protein